MINEQLLAVLPGNSRTYYSVNTLDNEEDVVRYPLEFLNSIKLSDQPDRVHDNPLKPVRTRDDVDKNLANAIVARFRRIFPTLRGRFPSIRSIFPANPQSRLHLTPSIFGESAVTRHDQYHRHRILCSLA